MTITDYYTRRAEGYHHRFSRGFLGWVRRAERQVIMEMLHPCREEHILDAGCGSGEDMLWIRTRTRYVCGVDANAAMVAQARTLGLPVTQGTLTTMSLQRKFDKILCAGVFEFCGRHDAIMQNFRRHLKQEGEVVLFLPGNNLLGWLYRAYHALHGNRVRLFSRSKIKQIHLQAGFSILALRKAGPLGYASKAKVTDAILNPRQRNKGLD